MPAKIADIDAKATDLDIIEQAHRHACELRDGFAALSELKQIDTYARNALEDARDRMIDVVEDLDFDIQQLRGPSEDVEYFSNNRDQRAAFNGSR